MVAQRLPIDHPARVAGLVLMGAFRTLHGHPGVQEFWDTAVSTLADPIDAGARQRISGEHAGARGPGGVPRHRASARA